MSKIFYCTKDEGFYFEDIHSKLPEASTLIEISENEYDKAILAQSKGSYISFNDKGEFVAADYVQSDEIITFNARKKRDSLLTTATDALQRHDMQSKYGIKTTLSDDQAKEIAVYAQALREVPQQKGFPKSITWPTIPETLK